MVTNLFTTFDPTTNMNVNNWLSIMIPFLIYYKLYWNIKSRQQTINNFTIIQIFNNINMNLTYKKKMNMMILTPLLYMIMISNLMGLTPYTFTPSSHLIMTLTLALPIWLTLMIYGWLQTTNNMFKHLLPIGTPMMLSVVMVSIETISNIIRPLTLSVRLMANMIAGHLLLTLLSDIPTHSPIMFFPILFPLGMLNILEVAVAMIQSYVFTMLTSLYINEIN